MTATPSTRAQIVEARTYLRPLDDEGTIFETPEQAADRIIGHQRWLWERAKGGMHRVTEVSDLPQLKFDDPIGYRVEDGWVMIRLTDDEEAELQELKNLFLDRKLTVAGRTRWLGGTAIAKERESSQFNCSFLEVRNAHDVVDATWLLLQGCGVGFRPVVGTLNGFAQPMEIEVIRSQRGPYEKGPENNVETFDPVTKTWTIKVGDSSSAWAKSAGKLVAGKYHAKKLVLDFSLVRGGGGRLKNYGWISSGDAQIAKAYLAIAQILNSAAGRLLTRIEILDIMNWLGTILSSRRSAEIAVMAYNEPEWQDFALAKKDMWTTGRDHRQMSNNSIMFYQKPTKYQLSRIFKIMMDAGGSEPGFINAQAAMKRAPWFKGVNPCVPADTRILTDKGYIPIADAVGTEVRVWNGSAWSAVTPFSTGVNPLVTVNLSDGTSLKCTPTHEWVVKDTYRSPPRKVAAQSLSAGMRLAKFDMPIVHGGKRVSGDMYSQGFYSGDGNTGLEFSWVYEPKFSVIPALVGRVTDKVSHGRVRWTHGPMREKTWVPHGAALEQRVDWLAGLLDADGNTVSDLSGTALQLVSCDLDFLKEVRLLLTTMGVQAKINLMHAEGRDFDGYVCRACWRLLINTADTHRLVNECGLKTLRLQIGKDAAQRDARRFVTVTSVVDTGRSEETYCFTEPQNNTGTFEGIVTGQCCEIMLGDRSFCVSGDTKLITRSGVTTIEDAVDKDIEIWNGKRWAAVKPFQTGTNDTLYRVQMGDGSYLDVTENHRFFVADRFTAGTYKEVLTKDLLSHSQYLLHTEPFTIDYADGAPFDNAYTAGFYVGDGYATHIDVYTPDKRDLPLAGVWSEDGEQNGRQKWRLHSLPFDHKFVQSLREDLSPVFSWNAESIIAFVSGLADADGSNTKHGGVRIYQANEGFCRDLQLLLTKVGIKSSINFMTDRPSNFGPRKPVFYVQISSPSKLVCKRLYCSRTLPATKKGKWQTIRSVTKLPGSHSSYCFSEPETTKGVFGNTLTGQCNLVETVLPRFNDDVEGLHRAHRLVARANYRQTCVNLDDGVLQRGWHELNEFLRLCGVGVTGVVSWQHWEDPAAWSDLREVAIDGANSMADELGLPRAKAVTTVKPSGTQSKALGIVGHEVPEGIHMPIGRFIFNRIRFSAHDPIINKLREANYAIEPDPSYPTGVLAVIPVEFAGIKFDTVQVGDETIEVNNESAIAQLDRYKLLMDNYVDHNASITISYDPEEVPEIVDWLMANWDTYVGVSFIYRQDATRTAADLGYKYLPQTLVSEKTYRAYADNLLPVNLSENAAAEMLADSMECAGGACPVR